MWGFTPSGVIRPNRCGESPHLRYKTSGAVCADFGKCPAIEQTPLVSNREKPAGFRRNPARFSGKPTSFRRQPASFSGIPTGFPRRPAGFSQIFTGFPRRLTSFWRRPTSFWRRPTGFSRRPTSFCRIDAGLGRYPTALVRLPRTRSEAPHGGCILTVFLSGSISSLGGRRGLGRGGSSGLARTMHPHTAQAPKMGSGTV